MRSDERLEKRAFRRGRDVVAFGSLLACMLLAGSPCAFALDPTLNVSQYAHTAWKIREGFSKGEITAIAQMPDGYLWLGTQFGLLRFDGVRNIPWQPPRDQSLPSNFITSLLAGRDGTLWIGTSKGLASWKGGKLTLYPKPAGQKIAALLEDRDGTVWAGEWTFPSSGRLCTIQKGVVHCDGEDGDLGPGVLGLYEDSKGTLWAGTGKGLWRWRPGPPKFYPQPGERNIRSFAESDDGAVLIGMNGGIGRIVDGKTEMAFRLPESVRQARVYTLLRDHDGGLWIGTFDRGIIHVHHGRTDVYGQSDGLSGDTVVALLEDREGSIWVATVNGLDRFREFAVATFSTNEGFSNVLVGSVLAARDGGIWISTSDGLNRWNNGQITIYPQRVDRMLTRAAQQGILREITGSGLPNQPLGALFQDDRGRIWVSTIGRFGYLENDRFVSISAVPQGFVGAIAQGAGEHLWISSQDHGLILLLRERVVRQIPWASLGHRDPAAALAADPLKGGLWLGFYDGGVAFFTDGQVRSSYGAADGIGEGTVNDFRLDSDATLWAATDGGLSRLKNGRIATLSRKNGLPCDAVFWSMEDDVHSFWLYTACGLVRIARPELDAWAAVVDKDKDSKPTIQASLFDSSDGVRSVTRATGMTPYAGKSPDGKLWFGSLDGVSVVDPRHIPFNKIPPPVHVEQITADRKTYDLTSDTNGNLRLPPLIRDLEIDYTALSLVAPEKVLFRYKLEGWDRDWQDVGNRRQAFYNNLPPRNYRFRVIASNNSGVWNEAGTFLDFSVAPAYYQTVWFRLSVVAAFLTLFVALYRLRLRHLARQFEVRLQERTRIAQDLHDTLLQGCLSASMQLHLAVDHTPEDLPIRNTLIHVQQLMARVIDEGRSALRGLRVPDSDTHDLEQAFVRARKEVAGGGDQVRFRVIVKGKPKPLHPLIRDEVYRIGREAIVNAFRHARAQQIEVEIDYEPRRLRVLVRDDGCGIDAAITSTGRDGHFGLSGMRERAQHIGGRVNISSRSAAGTEVDLSVPGRVVFQAERSRSRMWLEGLIGKKPEHVRKAGSGGRE